METFRTHLSGLGTIGSHSRNNFVGEILGQGGNPTVTETMSFTVWGPNIVAK
jgi:hypothetical protein